MICINCLHQKTSVINSRVRANGLSVWRRRKCAKCQYASTSEETISISGIYTVETPQGSKKFEVVTLLLSVRDALQAASADTEAALPLTQTIEEHLIQQHRPSQPLQSKAIAETALAIIRRYSALAGSIYAAKHGIAEKKPGRPRKQ